MVVVEFLLDLLEVEVVLSVGIPGQVEHIVQISILHRVVGRLGIEALQFAQFLVKLLLHVLAPLHLQAALVQFVDVVNVGTQLLLDGADLLLQEVFTLLLREVLTGTFLDVGLDFHQLLLAGQQLVEHVSALLDVTLFEHVLLLLRLKGDIGCQEVDQIHRVVDVLHGEGQFTSVGAHVAQHAQGDLDNRLHQHLELLVTDQRRLVLNESHRSAQVWRDNGYLLELAGRTTLQDDVGRAVGQLQDLDDRGDGAVAVQVALHRVLDVAVILADDGNGRMRLLGFLDEPQRLVTSHRHGHRHRGEKHHVAQRQDGDVVRLTVLDVIEVGHFADLGNDGENA